MILLVYLLYQILATGQTVLTAPIQPQLSAANGNRTILHTEVSPPWVSSATTRGTSDILWSCVVTLTACVYTALHLNVPPAKEGTWNFYWRKIKWVIVALFAPEIVLYCALTQFLEARKLIKDLNQLRATQQTSIDHDTGTERDHVQPGKFTLEYGFFVVMSGITTGDVAKLMDNEDRRFTLTPAGIRQFARDGIFFEVSPEIISNKSKANLLGKSLVCIQVIWFFIQWVTRVAAKYPLALVEIHTVVHVVCALSMYILWWKKPQDVSDPVVQDMSDCLDSLAVITLNTVFWDRVEGTRLWYFGEDGIERSKLFNDWKPDKITDVSVKDRLRWSKVCEWIDKYNRRNPADKITPSKKETLWVLLSRTKEPPVLDGLKAYISDSPAILSTRVHMLVLNPWNFVMMLATICQMLVILSAVYGGIHLTTWSFHFPSETEHLLWKIACIDIMATLPIGFLFILGVACLIDKSSKRFALRHANHLIMAFVLPLLTIYALSRIYIVVEAFISLRHVPIGVYAAVPWVQAIPHI